MDFGFSGNRLTFDDRGLKIIMVTIIALGFMLSAAIVGEAISGTKKGERYVTVRGVAEKDVKADIAIWPLRVLVMSKNAEGAKREVERSRQKVLRFLKANQVKAEDVTSQGLVVQEEQLKAGTRYVVERTILVRSTDVDKIKAVAQKSEQLIEAGIVADAQKAGDCTGPQFHYSQLEGLKPEMLASATASAYTLARQFENERDSHLGPIRHAAQGVFTVSDRDLTEAEAEKPACAADPNKKVRVAVVMDFYLH